MQHHIYFFVAYACLYIFIYSLKLSWWRRILVCKYPAVYIWIQKNFAFHFKVQTRSFCNTINLIRTWNSQRTSHTLPSLASYGVSNVRNFRKIDHVLTALHCIQFIRTIWSRLWMCLSVAMFCFQKNTRAHVTALTYALRACVVVQWGGGGVPHKCWRAAHVVGPRAQILPRAPLLHLRVEQLEATRQEHRNLTRARPQVLPIHF